MKNKAAYWWLVCLSASWMVTACTNRPFHVLPEDKLANLLTDLYIAEAAAKDNQTITEQSIFAKHKISEAKLDTSLVWYHAHLDKYQKVNEQIIAECTRRLAALKTKQARLQAAEKLDKSFFYPPEQFNRIDINKNNFLP